MNHAGRVLAAIIPAILGLAPAGRCAEHLVLPDGTGDFPTIRAAIAAAAAGDVIFLGDGVFRGADNRNLSYLGKTLTIRSRSGNPDACRIDCHTSDPGPQRGFLFVQGEEPKARLEAVSIWNGEVELAGQDGGAILIAPGSSATLVNCTFFGNRAVHGAAIYIDDESTTRIEGCRFLFNTADQHGGGLQVNGQSWVEVEDCIFWRNWARWGGALGCDYAIVLDRGNTYAQNGSSSTCAVGAYGGSIVMERSIVAFTTNGAAIDNETGTVWLYCCDLFGNAGGDWIGWLGVQLGVEGNICADPQFCDLPLGILDVRESSPCRPALAAACEGTCGRMGAGRVGCGPGDGCGPRAGDGLAGGGASCPASVDGLADAAVSRAVSSHAAAAAAAGDVTCLRAPNPLRPGQRVEWSLAADAGARAGRLAIHVHDVAGRRVRLLDARAASSGAVVWDGMDEAGLRLSRGIYIFRIQLNGRSLATRSIVIP